MTNAYSVNLVEGARSNESHIQSIFQSSNPESIHFSSIPTAFASLSNED